MNKREVQRAFDSCLNDVQFTPAHRRAVFARINEEKKKKRVNWQQMTAVGLMAATLVVVLALQTPRHDRAAQVATQGNGQGAAATTTGGVFAKLDLITLEDAMAIAKETLEEEGLMNDAFTYQGDEEEDSWLISAQLDGEIHYVVTVNNQTGEAEITYRKPVLAEDDLITDEELEAQARLEALEAYERDLTQRKGASYFWTMEERAKYSELAKAAGIKAAQWDTLPTSQDMTEQEAIAQARVALEKKKEYAGQDIAHMYAYASFLEDSQGNTTWSIVFLENEHAASGISVSFPSKKTQNEAVLQSEVEEEYFETVQPSTQDNGERVTTYYNPVGGVKYHLDQNCKSVSSAYLPLAATEDESLMLKLTPCEYCVGR